MKQREDTIHSFETESVPKPKSITVDLLRKRTKVKFSYRLTYVRWIVIILTGLYNIGSLYVQDTGPAIIEEIEDQLDINDFSFNFLYDSTYSIPNIILPFIAGYLTDVYGIRLILLLTSLFITIG